VRTIEKGVVVNVLKEGKGNRKEGRKGREGKGEKGREEERGRGKRHGLKEV